MRTIPLTQGKVALVDDEDYDLVKGYTWHLMVDVKTVGTTYYAVATPRVNGRTTCVLMHRLISRFPEGKDVDHWNGNGLDNRKQNLRICTRSQNNAGQKKRPGLSSRFKGVQWDPANRKWRALVKYHGQNFHLGRFSEEEDAAISYNVAAQLFFGEFARLNDV